MTVIWLEARRYHVDSISEPDDPHLVDMDEPIGDQCDCKGVQYKKTNKCHHIKAVIIYENQTPNPHLTHGTGLQPTPVRVAQ